MYLYVNIILGEDVKCLDIYFCLIYVKYICLILKVFN